MEDKEMAAEAARGATDATVGRLNKRWYVDRMQITNVGNHKVYFEALPKTRRENR